MFAISEKIRHIGFGHTGRTRSFQLSRCVPSNNASQRVHNTFQQLTTVNIMEEYPTCRKNDSALAEILLVGFALVN